MEVIDGRLRRRSVPFSHRALAGLSEVARELKIGLPGWKEDREPVEGCYDGMDLTIRVLDWFEDRYGKRARWDPRPGRTVVIMRDDPWEIVIPRFFGSHRFFASTTEPSDPVHPVGRPGQPLPRFNVVEAVSDLAPGLRRVLTKEELNAILEAFRVALEDYTLIEQLREDPLAREAMGDYDAAVRELMAGRARYGASRWASLQASEKMLKAYLARAGQKVKRTHDLSVLVSAATKVGLGPVPHTWIATVQCSPSVRYGEHDVTLPEVVAAHHCSLDLGAHVASFMVGKSPLPLRL